GFRVPMVYEAVATGATGLTVDEVVLYDTDPTRLRVMERIIGELAHTLPGAPVLTTTDSLDVAVADTDFVFAAVRVGGPAGRVIDERVALNLGLLGQETIGPGGLAYALRSIPVARELTDAVKRLAPNAWVINFTNPAGIVTEAMRQILGERVVGICDTPIGLARRVGRQLGVELDDPSVEIDYIGLNHLGWLREVRVDGVNRLPEVLADDNLLDGIEEARLMGFDWVRQTRALPNEYLFYYLFPDEARRRIQAKATTRGEYLLAQQSRFYRTAVDDTCCASPLNLWRTVLRDREGTYMAEAREGARREEDIAGGGYQEVALRLMTALALGGSERMILDVGNGLDDGTRIVPELPDDMVVEVPCVVDRDGVHPQAVGPVALDQLGLMARLRASERKILEAAVTGNEGAAWEGFSIHPLVDSPVLGRQLVDGYKRGHPEVAALFA
ncbi:MAG TPA: 6-phospho-beta-glucosidase, partial [Tessaracoccus flavescens]|nr:6-phospho-beta-glucosidase [Tessaracoccus flavescens]